VIRRAFAALPDSVEHRRFRADSAAYHEDVLHWLSEPAQRIERFTVSADMSEPLRKLCDAVPEQDWSLYQERTNETVHWSEVEHTAGRWTKQAQPLRTLVLRIQKRQGLLFANGADRLLLAIVTNDRSTDGAALIRWHYQKAGAGDAALLTRPATLASLSSARCRPHHRDRPRRAQKRAWSGCVAVRSLWSQCRVVSAVLPDLQRAEREEDRRPAA
jgi:hypothetical protein